MLDRQKKESFFQNEITRYRLRQFIPLSLVPVVCSCIVFPLVWIFATMNLSYLGAIKPDARAQVEHLFQSALLSSMRDFAFAMIMLLLCSACATFFITRWACSPFQIALRRIRLASGGSGSAKEHVVLSGSNQFLQLLDEFLLDQKSAATPSHKDSSIHPHRLGFTFFVKFNSVFVLASVATGMMLGSLVMITYEKITDMSLGIIDRDNQAVVRAFLMDQQHLDQKVSIGIGVFAFLCYFVLSLPISWYMETMLQVFTRGLAERSFPIRLRRADVYHELANAINAVAVEREAKSKPMA